MKTILCYGDSNTWGADPATGNRLDYRNRWPTVMGQLLNQNSPQDQPDFWIVEEGLCGRTTTREDPVEGDRNGFRQLLPILESHKPLDLVILMLGTNDLKVRFSPTEYDIARGAQRVAKGILESHTGKGDGTPRVLMICPPPTEKLSYFKSMFGDCREISEKLAGRYRQFAKEIGVDFLDAGEFVKSSDRDGIHLEAGEHKKLAEAVARAVRDILSYGP